MPCIRCSLTQELAACPQRGKRDGKQLLIPLCLAEQYSASCALPSVHPLQCSEQEDLQEQLENSLASPAHSVGVHPSSRVVLLQETYHRQLLSQREGHSDKWPLEGNN